MQYEDVFSIYICQYEVLWMDTITFLSTSMVGCHIHWFNIYVPSISTLWLPFRGCWIILVEHVTEKTIDGPHYKKVDECSYSNVKGGPVMKLFWHYSRRSFIVVGQMKLFYVLFSIHLIIFLNFFKHLWILWKVFE